MKMTEMGFCGCSGESDKGNSGASEQAVGIGRRAISFTNIKERAPTV